MPHFSYAKVKIHRASRRQQAVRQCSAVRCRGCRRKDSAADATAPTARLPPVRRAVRRSGLAGLASGSSANRIPRQKRQKAQKEVRYKHHCHNPRCRCAPVGQIFSPAITALQRHGKKDHAGFDDEEVGTDGKRRQEFAVQAQTVVFALCLFSVSRKIQPSTDAIMMTKFAIFSQPSCGRNADRTLMASISAVAVICRM